MKISLTSFFFSGVPLLQHYFLKMIYDVAWPSNLLSLQLILQTQNYKPLRVSSTRSWLVLPSFYSFQLLIFVLVHCTAPQTQNKTWVWCYCLYYKIPSLPLSNPQKHKYICTFAYICYCSHLTHWHFQIPLGSGFLRLCLFIFVHLVPDIWKVLI